MAIKRTREWWLKTVAEYEEYIRGHFKETGHRKDAENFHGRSDDGHQGAATPPSQATVNVVSTPSKDWSSKWSAIFSAAVGILIAMFTVTASAAVVVLANPANRPLIRETLDDGIKFMVTGYDRWFPKHASPAAAPTPPVVVDDPKQKELEKKVKTLETRNRALQQKLTESENGSKQDVKVDVKQLTLPAWWDEATITQSIDGWAKACGITPQLIERKGRTVKFMAVCPSSIFDNVPQHRPIQ